jgi:hypothetical protein
MFPAWKVWNQRWKLIVLGKLLERIPKFQPQRFLSYYELKKHKACFMKDAKLLKQRKQAKLQCLEDANKIEGDNLNTRSKVGISRLKGRNT